MSASCKNAQCSPSCAPSSSFSLPCRPILASQILAPPMTSCALSRSSRWYVPAISPPTRSFYGQKGRAVRRPTVNCRASAVRQTQRTSGMEVIYAVINLAGMAQQQELVNVALTTSLRALVIEQMWVQVHSGTMSCAGCCSFSFEVNAQTYSNSAM